MGKITFGGMRWFQDAGPVPFDLLSRAAEAMQQGAKSAPSFLLNPQSWNEDSGRHASGKRNDGDVESRKVVRSPSQPNK
jgi:hypothetical protein